MVKLLYCEFMLFLMVILAIVLHNDINKSRGPILTTQTMFRSLLIVNILAMFFDMISVLSDGTNFFWSKAVVNLSIMFYYMLHSTVGYFYLLYVDFELYPDDRRFRKRVPFYTIFVAILVLMSLASLATNWFFYVDSNNCYHRGPLFMLPTFVTFVYVAYGVVMTFVWASVNKIDNVRKREVFERVMAFPMFPCIGAILQLAIPGSTWTFPCTALALLMTYILMQNGQMSRDYLTGLYNRGQLENYLNNRLKNMKTGTYFFLILIDLDKFKSINDTYGHLEGDDALIHTADILRSVCKRKEDFVARLGGDEFVIIGPSKEKEAVNNLIERMNQAAKNYNEKSNKPYEISFSAGYAIYDGEGSITLDKMITIADDKMYEVKKAKKKNGQGGR